MMRKGLALVAMVALTGLIGCSGSNAVDGTVTLDGTPVSGASITLVPADGKGQGGSGISDASGHFSIKAGGKSAGIASGAYKVVVTKVKSSVEGMGDKVKGDKQAFGADYFKMMDKAKGGQGGPAASEPKSELPQKYANEKTTPLEVRVPLATRPWKLELSSK